MFGKYFFDKNEGFGEPFHCVIKTLYGNIEGLNIYIRDYTNPTCVSLITEDLSSIFNIVVSEYQKNTKVDHSATLNFIRIYEPMCFYGAIPATTKYFRLRNAFCMPYLRSGFSLAFKFLDNSVEVQEFDIIDEQYTVLNSMSFRCNRLHESELTKNPLWNNFEFFVTDTCIADYTHDVVEFCKQMQQSCLMA